MKNGDFYKATAAAKTATRARRLLKYTVEEALSESSLSSSLTLVEFLVPSEPESESEVEVLVSVGSADGVLLA